MKKKKFNLETFQKRSIFAVAIVVFIIANILVRYLTFRLDFSAGQAHTLSNSTKKIISNLDDSVRINVFISSDLPLRLLPLKTDVVDLVSEYQRQGMGKILVQIRDPKKDQDALKEAQEYGVPELQFSQVEQDKYAVSTTYFGIGIKYGDKKEAVPQATSIESLEYDITSAIYKMAQKEAIKLGILGAQANPFNPQEDEFATFKRILSQQFLLETLNTATETANLKTILVFDDARQYVADDTKSLSNYIKKGGKIIFLVDGVSVLGELQTATATHNLFSFFKDFGIILNQDLVLSASSELANFSTGSVAFLTPYPFWIKTEGLTFPWVSSLDTKKTTTGSTKILVKSDKNSWIQKDTFILTPNEIPSPNTSDLKIYNLVAEYSGKNGSKMTVIPSSRFVKEQFLSRTNENINFLLNMLSSYASGGALSGIRSRSLSIYPLKNIGESEKDVVKYLAIFLLPGLFVLFGSFRLVKRK